MARLRDGVGSKRLLPEGRQGVNERNAGISLQLTDFQGLANRDSGFQDTFSDGHGEQHEAPERN